MSCAIAIQLQPTPITVITTRFVTTTTSTCSFAASPTADQTFVYSNKQLLDKSGNVVATLARTKTALSCAGETFEVTSPFLEQPVTVVATGGWGSRLVGYAWRLADDGSMLEILGLRYSVTPEIVLRTATQDTRVVGTVAADNTVTIEAGVDAAAVLLLCRMWSHAQTTQAVYLAMSLGPLILSTIAAISASTPLSIAALVVWALYLPVLLVWFLRFRG